MIVAQRLQAFGLVVVRLAMRPFANDGDVVVSDVIVTRDDRAANVNVFDAVALGCRWACD